MNIDPSQPTNTGLMPQQAKAASSMASQMDMNAFLVMFTTQLQRQDPLNPLESHEMAAQLAQFSSVEKLTSLNTNILQQTDYLASINNAQALHLIGKDIVASSNQLSVKDGTVSQAGYDLPEPADVTIRIYNDQQQLVRTLQMDSLEAGSQQIQWDGRSENGEDCSNGTYFFEIEAIGAKGPVEVSGKVNGNVYGFRMENGTPYLVLEGPGGVKVSYGSLIEANQPSERT